VTAEPVLLTSGTVAVAVVVPGAIVSVGSASSSSVPAASSPVPPALGTPSSSVSTWAPSISFEVCTALL
jgi:hypothetical protein